MKKALRNDPAVGYARDILSGAIPSGPYIRDAVQRFLDDLERPEGWGYYYDPEAADRACRFFPAILRLSDGSFEGIPFNLLPWQEFVVRNIYGWKRDKDNYRRFRKAYIETGKGSGKSPLVAGMGIRAICGDDENRAQGYVIARTADQAAVTFEPAVAMVESSPRLSHRLKVIGGEHPYRIVYHKTRSFLSRVSSSQQGKGKSGPIPHIIIVDEYHEHETSAMRDMYAAGVKNRRQPLVIMITNSGVSLQSPCGQEHVYARAVSAQEIEDNEYFAMVFGCEEDDDPMNDESCWIKANPSLAETPEAEAEGDTSIPGYDYIRAQVREAVGMPSKRSVVERLNFCRWVDAEAPWIDRDKWIACEVPDSALSSDKERRKVTAWIALDMSQKTDLCAATIAFDFGDFVEVETKIWSPKETLAARSERDSVPYVQWAEQGYIEASEGAVVDFSAIAKWIGEVNDRYKIGGLAYDPWRIDLLQRELDAEGIATDRKPGRGIYLVPHPQGFVAGSKPLEDIVDEDLQGLRLWMPRSIDFSEKAILQGNLRVRVNPALRMAVAGMVVVADAANNRRPTKTKSLLRIDPGVSLVMALGALYSARVMRWKAIEDISEVFAPL